MSVKCHNITCQVFRVTMLPGVLGPHPVPPIGRLPQPQLQLFYLLDLTLAAVLGSNLGTLVELRIG